MLLAGGLLAGCGGGHNLAKDEGRLHTTGEAYVARGGKGLKRVSGSTVLHAGDRVEIRDGTGSVDMAVGGVLELRPPAVFRFGATPFLQSGDMLVEPARRSLSVATDAAAVTVDSGVTRLSRTLALTVTAYRGRSTITSPGSSETLPVRAPRRATVAARGVLPDKADAAAYDPADGWDRRYLATAIELGNQLERDSQGFARQLPAGEGTTPGFFRLLLPGLERVPELPSVLDPTVSPADNLVGAALTLRGTQGSFTDRWKAVFAFRDPDRAEGSIHGAQVNWGLVAIDQDVVDLGPVSGEVDAAIGRAPKSFVAPLQPPGTTTATSPNGSTGTPTTPTTSAPVPTTAPPRSTPTTTAPTPSTTVPPSPVPTVPQTPVPTPPPPSPLVPTPPPTGTPIDKVVDPLVDTLNGLLPPGGSPAP